MTDREKIIELAMKCGFESHHAKLNHPKELEAFYRAAQAEAFEQAAAVCDEQQLEPECPERASYCAEAIRALKEK